MTETRTDQPLKRKENTMAEETQWSDQPVPQDAASDEDDENEQNDDSDDDSEDDDVDPDDEDFVDGEGFEGIGEDVTDGALVDESENGGEG